MINHILYKGYNNEKKASDKTDVKRKRHHVGSKCIMRVHLKSDVYRDIFC